MNFCQQDISTTKNNWDNEQDAEITKMVLEMYEALPKPMIYQQSENNDADKVDNNNLDLILKQEVSMYNQLMDVMHSTLADVLDGLKGMF